MATREPSLSAGLDGFVEAVGKRVWDRRIKELTANAAGGSRSGQALRRRHAIEFTVERLRRQGCTAAATEADRCIGRLAGRVAQDYASLPAAARARLRTWLHAGLADHATLIPAFHLARTAQLQRAREFQVCFAGFEDDAPFDLLIRRGGMEAEVACDVVSAEEGRDVHRGAWVNLVDRIDPDLQTWLADHPGRYLLKLTLPQGLGATDQQRLATLHARIRTLLQASRRADHDEAAVLRLDPLMLAGAQADEHGLLRGLRQEFGPEAHLAVAAHGGGVFVMAARASREDEVAVAIRRRMAAIAPARLTGTRPGILAMFVEDTDRTEWRQLRDLLKLEGEARQFLTHKEARTVVAVTCASRFELLGCAAPDAAADGELRFRNPAHPAAKHPELAPAVLSSG